MNMVNIFGIKENEFDDDGWCRKCRHTCEMIPAIMVDVDIYDYAKRKRIIKEGELGSTRRMFSKSEFIHYFISKPNRYKWAPQYVKKYLEKEYMKMILHASIKKELIEQLKVIIECKNGCSLSTRESFGSTYWLVDKDNSCEYSNEFRISTLGNYRMTISRVCFKNRRCGTMTEILKALIAYCREEKIQEILIQSVETKEMMDFCTKNHFIPSEYNILCKDVLMGDYILKI